MEQGTPRSLWMATSEAPPRPRLEAEVRCDVAVIGAGITGLTTALLLKEAGLTVAVLEMGRVCQGVTGHTTAKVTSLHELIYASVTDQLGEDAARAYGQANQAGLAEIARIVDAHTISCALERRAAVTWTADASMLEQVRAEAEVAARLGLPARFTEEVALDVEALGAVVFDGQLQLHPREYVLGLAAAVDGEGSTVYEHTKVTGVADGAPARLETEHGADVLADHVVVATHLPITDRGGFFAKAHPKRSYALSVRVPAGTTTPMAINAESPTRSVRDYSRDGATWLVISGESHKPGVDEDERRRWDALEEWARATFSVEAVDHRWSAQDYVSVDQLPYVGRVSRTSRALWTATGFRKWGLSNGTAAALIIRDGVQGRENPWASVLDANRVTPKASAKKLVSENLKVAGHFVGDRVGLPGGEAVESLEDGEGAVVRLDGQAYAVSRDGERLCSVSPVCPHMGCHVAWNPAERSWDCPCHGSRFTAEGTVVQGPAVRDLEDKPLPG